MNYTLSSLARYLGRRQQRRYGSGTAGAVAAIDPEDAPARAEAAAAK